MVKRKFLVVEICWYKEQLTTGNPLLLFEQHIQLKGEHTEMNREVKHLTGLIKSEKKTLSNKELSKLIGNLKIKMVQVNVDI